MITIKFIIFLILLIFPLGQLTRIPIGSAEVNLYLQDLLVTGLVLIWSIGQIGRKKWQVFPFLTKPILFFVVAAIISLLVNSSRLNQKELIISGLYLLRWMVYAGVYFVIYDLTKLQGFKPSWFQGGLVLAGILTAILGLLQYFLYPDLSNLVYLGWDPHRFRVFGTFLDSGFLGLILVLTLILIINNWKNWDNWGKWGKKFIIIGGAFVYITLALTYSRASYLAFMAGMTVFAGYLKSIKFLLIVVSVGLLTIIILPQPTGSEAVRLKREETAWARIRNWQQSLTIIKDYPIFGVGFNSYRFAQRDYGYLESQDWQTNHGGAGGDSSLLFVLATTGLLGFLGYSGILVTIWKKGSRVVKVSLVVLLVGSLFSNALFYPWIMVWIWILLGSTSTE